MNYRPGKWYYKVGQVTENWAIFITKKGDCYYKVEQ